MLYEYDEPLVGYPLSEFAQPPHKIIPHLDSAFVELYLSQEEMWAILQEQEEMMREEEKGKNGVGQWYV